ncbi:hypothetical protein IF1G_06014 [Cordyceps javanica]|uniref:Uncharacterized protein n=1 Tax=Cordyceps javanica TaxID=43265 RepID=A0A545V001_9HYPO|nr:hypothetical protein IF1G_06014 [Cordyceps javanica]
MQEVDDALRIPSSLLCLRIGQCHDACWAAARLAVFALIRQPGGLGLGHLNRTGFARFNHSAARPKRVPFRMPLLSRFSSRPNRSWGSHGNMPIAHCKDQWLVCQRSGSQG